MVDDEKTSNIWLFSLGLTAGLLACYFPRLMTLLTNEQQNVVISLFTVEFVITATIIAVIIGLSMLWFYANTEEQAKNIFIAALALPAVLSGGINMSNLSTAATRDILILNNQAIELQSHLEKILGIESVVVVESDKKSLSFLPSFFLIGTAYAAEPQAASLSSARSGIEITVDSLNQNYYILLESSTDKGEIFRNLKKVNEIPLGRNAYVYSQNNNYYLLLSGPTTKSNALIEAIKLKTTFGLLPKLLVIK